MFKLRSLLAVALLISVLKLSAQDISAVIASKANAIQSKLVEWRRQIHQHPELGNREFKTSAFIAAHLKSLLHYLLKEPLITVEFPPLISL